MTSYRFAPTSFLPTLAAAQEGHEKIRESTTSWVEFVTRTDVDWYLAEDYLSGFGVTDSGELVGVFSVVKGRGDELVQAAVELGAWHLDCFDGYLPTLYRRNGFRVTHEEANWTPGGPSVVYMERGDD